MMTWQQYLNDLQQQNNELSINFDNHFYLKFNKKNQDNYFKTYYLYKIIFTKLLNNVLNLFQWDLKKINEPKEIVENGFVYYGGVSIFKDADEEIKLLPAVPINKFNIYGEPEFVRVCGFNGFSKEIKIIKEKKDFKINTGIYVRDNDAMILSFEIVKNYARMITDKTRALEIATQKLKKPYFFQTTKNNQKNIEKLHDKIENNEPLILLYDELVEKNDNLIDNDIDPDNIKAIKEAILFDNNQFLEIFGINTDPNPDKQERKLVDEINSNNNYLELNRIARLKFRKELKDKAKKICGVNIDFTEVASDTRIDRKTTDEKSDLEEAKRPSSGASIQRD